MKYRDNQFHIFVDHINVDTIEGSGTFSIGKTIVKDLYTVSKNNMISQVTGQQNQFKLYVDGALIKDVDELDSIIQPISKTNI